MAFQSIPNNPYWEYDTAPADPGGGQSQLHAKQTAGIRTNTNGTEVYVSCRMIDSVSGSPQLIVDSGLDIDDSWIFQNEWQYNAIDKKAEVLTPLTASSWVYQNYSYTAGTYVISADITRTAGSCILGISSTQSTAITTSGFHSFTLTVTGPEAFAGCRGTIGFVGSVDNISVREVLDKKVTGELSKTYWDAQI